MNVAADHRPQSQYSAVGSPFPASAVADQPIGHDRTDDRGRPKPDITILFASYQDVRRTQTGDDADDRSSVAVQEWYDQKYVRNHKCRRNPSFSIDQSAGADCHDADGSSGG
jgi:hypothetical protein